MDNKLNFNQIKKYFLYITIGGLITSAIISIMAILIGDFSDFIQKSLFTTLLIVIHSLIALAFVSVNADHRSKIDEIMVNVLFGITIASFATSILAVWDVITGSIVGDFYLLYFYTFIATLLCHALLQANRIDKSTRILADTSIMVTIFLYMLLLPSIFIEYPYSLPEIYYREIAATSILLGTTSILTAIINKLYVNKHPELILEKDGKKHSSKILKIIIIVSLTLIALIYVVPYLFFMLIYRPSY